MPWKEDVKEMSLNPAITQAFTLNFQPTNVQGNLTLYTAAATQTWKGRLILQNRPIGVSQVAFAATAVFRVASGDANPVLQIPAAGASSVPWSSIGANSQLLMYEILAYGDGISQSAPGTTGNCQITLVM